MNNVDKIKKR